MASMNAIHQKLGNTVCRRCIRKYYRVNLEPSDCKYAMYPNTCDCCGEAQNIVTGLRPSGVIKLMFK